MKLSRNLLFVTALVASACFSASAQAQTPDRMLAGFAPGGGVDILARIFAEKWGEATGRPVVGEKNGGARAGASA